MTSRQVQLDVPCITHPLNTPHVGQEPTHYFAEHTGRGSSGKILNVHFLPTSFIGSLLDLPNEILAHILELGYFQFNENDAPDTAFRTLASHISSRFRQLVLYTPSLWSVIRLSPNDVSPTMDTYLQRSMDYPLDIKLTCFWEPQMAEYIVEKLLPHIKRWKRLSMTVVDNVRLTLLGHEGAPSLEYLDVSYIGFNRHISVPPRLFGGGLPRLKHLCLRHIDIHSFDIPLRGLRTLEIRGYGTWPTYSQLNRLIGGSENLEELIFQVKPGHVLEQVFPDDVWDSAHPQILIPNLRSITIHTSEWLSSKISVFIRLFACPKLESLVLLETSTLPNQTPHTIMSYTCRSTPSIGSLLSSSGRILNHLILRNCSLQWGCRAMLGNTVTTLELHAVHWPKLSTLKTVFASLKGLVNLSIYALNPKGAVVGLLNDVESNDVDTTLSVTLPHLEQLVIEFTRHTWSAQDSTEYYTSVFLRIFVLPVIRSLRFSKIMYTSQWKAIVDTFASQASEYHSLTSPELAEMSRLVPIDPHDQLYTNFSTAFPQLHHISLDAFSSSNDLLQQLTLSDTPQSLSVHGDPNVSNRVISMRKRAGTSLFELHLDHHLSSNPESLAWIQEHVEVDEVENVP